MVTPPYKKRHIAKIKDWKKKVKKKKFHKLGYIFDNLYLNYNYLPRITTKMTLSVSLDCDEKGKKWASAFFLWVLYTVHETRSMDFSKFFFKTESHSIIHTFKNYFATMFSIFNNKQYLNRPLKRKIPNHAHNMCEEDSSYYLYAMFNGSLD